MLFARHLERRTVRWALLLAAATLVPAAAAIIPAADAGSHAGRAVTVQGRVSEVETAPSGATFIDMDGRFPKNAFTAVVMLGGGAAQAEGWRSLTGRIADVTGTVQVVDGKPEIVAASPSDVRASQRTRTASR